MMSEPPPHFNDHGFEFDFFQVLGQARRHRQYPDTAATASVRTGEHPACSSSSASGRFKLQKKKKKKKSSSSSRDRKHGWSWSWSLLRSTLDLFYFKVKGQVHIGNSHEGQPDNPERSSAKAIARHSRHSVSGPLYLAESRNTPLTRHKGYSRSGPLAERVPYVCLSPDFKGSAAPHPPLYLVT
ncbi:hypothetical protein MLD38_038849 [Melastoma candidum]|uniref:Uncharacterized protein n=1 Tax=Melastoma candidum TaxID=119954 RepID=A0ACB9L1E4_9MYRT|nr:hypothetical protein MLD38_038849 [Melastoma candidum]